MPARSSPGCSHGSGENLSSLSSERRAHLERQNSLRQRVQWVLKPYPTMGLSEGHVEPETASNQNHSRNYLPKELIEDIKSIGNYHDMSDVRKWGEGDQVIFYYAEGASLNELCLPEDPHNRLQILGKYVLINEIDVSGNTYLRLYPKNCLKHAYLGNETIFRNIKNSRQVSALMADDIRHRQDEKTPHFSHIQIEFLHKKALELKGETPEKTIDNVYQYIIHTFVYEPEMASYFSGELGYMPDIAPGNYGGLATQYKKEGVCAGIARSFVYMLSFAGIEDVHVVSGLVPGDHQIFWRRFFGRDTWTHDKFWFLPWKLWKGVLPIARNFGFIWKDVWTKDDKKNMGHAWNRIGLRHYDPTFDLGKNDPKWFGVDESTMRYKGREW